MPLVVPVLRFLVVFLNVYETFKTLKPPPPSARRGGQPSVRAISQRKRDLKGCLAIWVVWSCYAAYERTFDRIVSIFLPFYSEIKSVFLLFLLLTRAKGAEPLFLHVLRPLIKPYATVVDPILELSCDIGDFLFALLQVPLDSFLSSSWFRFWRDSSEEEHGRSPSDTDITLPDTGSSTRISNHSSIPRLADHDAAVWNDRHGSVRSVSDNQRPYLDDGPSRNNPARPRVSRDQHLKSVSTTSLPAYSEHPFQPPPRYSQTLSRHNGHQIWYPPASVYAASDQEAPISTVLGTAPEYRSPEWRTYPAFPSAYPPTPLVASVSLPGSVTVRSDNDRVCVSGSPYPPIPEDEQGFSRTLKKQHERHPGFAYSSSSNNKIPLRTSTHEESSDATRHPDEDALLDDSMYSSETGLSEDDYGTSLRTPYRSPEAIPSSAYSSAENMTSALTATDNAYPLQTKTSSDSLSSGSSSLAGRKRAHQAFQGNTRNTNTLAVAQSRNATLRGRPAPPPVPQVRLESSTSEGEDESADGDDYEGVKAKRPRVLDPLKRGSTVRPAAKGVGNARKVPLSSRTVIARGRTVATAPQTAVRPVTKGNLIVKGKKSQVIRGGPQGVIKSSSTSSSQSGTLRGRTY